MIVHFGRPIPFSSFKLIPKARAATCSSLWSSAPEIPEKSQESQPWLPAQSAQKSRKGPETNPRLWFACMSCLLWRSLEIDEWRFSMAKCVLGREAHVITCLEVTSQNEVVVHSPYL